MLFKTVVIAALTTAAVGLNNGVGKLPKMGYDSKFSMYLYLEDIQVDLTKYKAFNAFECSYDQSKVLAQVDAMVRYGLVASGYNVSTAIYVLDKSYPIYLTITVHNT